MCELKINFKENAMSISERIKDWLDNYKKYVTIMATLSDKELAKKLDLVYIQMDRTEQQSNDAGSTELLEVWHQQIIEARIYKVENEIPDAPKEIELTIADIETFVSKTPQERQLSLSF